jgi:hypothetical protein
MALATCKRRSKDMDPEISGAIQHGPAIGAFLPRYVDDAFAGGSAVEWTLLSLPADPSSFRR